MKTAVKAAPKMVRAARAVRGVRDPRKAALMKAARWAAEQLHPEPKRSVGRNAAIGLGAAVLAVPLGLWLGRRLREGE